MEVCTGGVENDMIQMNGGKRRLVEDEDSDYEPEVEEEDEDNDDLDNRKEGAIQWVLKKEQNETDNRTTNGNDGGTAEVDHILNERTSGVNDETFGQGDCPECGKPFGRRPVKEICGHVKCRSCYINSSEDDDCKQCYPSQDSDGPPTLSPQTSVIQSAAETLNVRPDDFVFQLDSSSTSTLAVVSADTLKELGINPDFVTVSHQPSLNSTDPPTTLIISQEPVPDLPIRNEPETATTVVAPTTSPSAKSRSSKGRKTKSKQLSTAHILPLDEKQFKCSQCSKIFSNKYHRNWHAYCDPNNGPRPYICECKEEFISQSHYLYHVRVKHTGEKPYKCAICGVSFVQKVKLNRHMIVHTDRKKKWRNTEPGTKFVCAFCDKTFDLMCQIKRHMVIHTEKRPWACDICDKTFKMQSVLQSHMKVHEGNRPFACPEPGCSKAFQVKKDLTRHSLIHTGEQPFKCEIAGCTSSFRRKDNLVRHLRGTHQLKEQVARFMGAESLLKWEAEKALRNGEGRSDDGKAIRKLGTEIITGI